MAVLARLSERNLSEPPRRRRRARGCGDRAVRGRCRRPSSNAASSFLPDAPLASIRRSRWPSTGRLSCCARSRSWRSRSSRSAPTRVVCRPLVTMPGGPGWASVLAGRHVSVIMDCDRARPRRGATDKARTLGPRGPRTRLIVKPVGTASYPPVAAIHKRSIAGRSIRTNRKVPADRQRALRWRHPASRARPGIRAVGYPFGSGQH